MVTPIFVVDPLPEAILSIRRSAPQSYCTLPPGQHQASADVGRAQWPPANRNGEPIAVMDGYLRRAPLACRCGYLFGPDDPIEGYRHRLYTDRRPVHEGGWRGILADAPPGALWLADWYPESWRGPDGHCLVLQLPDLTAFVLDAPYGLAGEDLGLDRYRRTGEPPELTVDREVDTGTYRGTITRGTLSDDLDGRRYPLTGFR